MGERLTDAVVKGLTCPAGKKDVLVFDTTLRGFYVRVQANRTKTFGLQYKVAGRKKRLVIGTFGAEVTTKEARDLAEEARGKFRAGGDPVAERRAADTAARAALAAERYTVGALIEAWADQHLVDKSESYRRVAPRTLKGALPIGRPAASFTKADAIAVLDDVRKQRGPIAADRIRAMARAAWAWAGGRGDVETNPWAGVPKGAKESSRDRWLDDSEIVRLWKAAGEEGHPWTGIVRLLLLTGQRRSEVAEMAWAELDLDRAEWNIPRERTKNHVAHTVPLSAPALDILRALPRRGRLVFENEIGTAPSGFGRLKARLDKAMGDDVPPWVLHDNRRTVATGLQKQGLPIPVVEAVLNHVSGSRSGIVGVYQRHDYAKEKRAALDAWAAHIMATVAKAEKAGSRNLDRGAIAEAPPAVEPVKKTRGRKSGSGARRVDLSLLEPMAATPDATTYAISKRLVGNGRIKGEHRDAEQKAMDRLNAEMGKGEAGKRVAAIKDAISARVQMTKILRGE